MRHKTADVLVRNMTLDDLPVVLQIDRLSFPVPWPERSYRYELTKNPASQLLVAESTDAHPNSVIGFVGCWMILEEVHISTLAVHPGHRGQGIGEKLLFEMIKWAVGKGAEIASLEVRVSNYPAINMYRKHGFEIKGRKANYYRDNNEDALVMILNNLPSWRVRTGGGDQ